MYRALIALVLVACSGPPQRVGTQPSWRHPGDPTSEASETSAAPSAATHTGVFTPIGPAASRYNEPIQPPPRTPLGDSVTAVIRDAAVQARISAPLPDARLFRACAELAEIVPEEGKLDYGLEMFALQREGIVEPTPHFVSSWTSITSPDEVAAGLRSELAGIVGEHANRFGVAAAKRKSDGTGVVVFIAETAELSLDPVPRAVAANSTIAIAGTLSPGYATPEVFVTREDGAVERFPVEVATDARFKSTVPCAKHRGRQQVEVEATGGVGPVTVANFPVWCASASAPDAPPPMVVREDISHMTSDEAERRLLALVNKDRLAVGLPGLVWSDEAAAVARAHSEEMRRTKVIAHLSPTTGSASDRVRAASIKTTIVLENIATDYSVSGAHDGLMNSPAHRTNLLSPSATHIGIGVAFDDSVPDQRLMIVTQVFIRVQPKIDPPKVVELVRQRIARVSHADVNAALAALAQNAADNLAAGKPEGPIWGDTTKKLEQLARYFTRMSRAVQVVGDLDSLDGKELIGDENPDDIGIGIAQGTHPELGENAVWVVVLMAQRAKK